MKSVIENSVAVISSIDSKVSYPTELPYNPAQLYPEFNNKFSKLSSTNDVYMLFRKALFLCGLDKKHFDMESWNPFGDLIKPGQHVLIKPNFVRHIHMAGKSIESVITHGSIIRCALDYVALALKGSGSITIGDAPVQSADFEKIIDHLKIRQISDYIERIWQIPVKIVDFRLSSVQINNNYNVVKKGILKGDINGYLKVDLGKNSMLAEIAEHCSKFRVTSYDCNDLALHHNKKTNEYLIPKTVLDADVIINLPKLKTHRKVGITSALKNLVGINGYKDWLPHHRCGSKKYGGDEYKYPSILQRIRTVLVEQIDVNIDSFFNMPRRTIIRIISRLLSLSNKQIYEEGSWYGNDTIWRTVLDLNRLLLYSDKLGKMQNSVQRSVFTIVDGIIAGEGEGPMQPDAKKCNMLICGLNPVAVDTTIATLIGFDFNKIPLLSNSYKTSIWPMVTFLPAKISTISEIDKFCCDSIVELSNEFEFIPPSGWIGHIEQE